MKSQSLKSRYRLARGKRFQALWHYRRNFAMGLNFPLGLLVLLSHHLTRPYTCILSKQLFDLPFDLPLGRVFFL